MIGIRATPAFVSRKLRCDRCRAPGSAAYRLHIGIYAGSWYVCRACMPGAAERGIAELVKHPSLRRMTVDEIEYEPGGWWRWNRIAEVVPRTQNLVAPG